MVTWLEFVNADLDSPESVDHFTRSRLGPSPDLEDVQRFSRLVREVWQVLRDICAGLQAGRIEGISIGRFNCLLWQTPVFYSVVCVPPFSDPQAGHTLDELRMATHISLPFLGLAEDGRDPPFEAAPSMGYQFFPG